MKILIYTGEQKVGSSGRGIGVYTKKLYESLLKFPKLTVSMGSLQTMPDPDIIHYPSFNFFSRELPLFKKNKVVVTVHDTIPLIYPNNYPSGLKGSLNLMYQKLAIRGCDAVIADSETSRKDVVRFLGVNQDRIHVSYLGPTLAKIDYSKSSLNSIIKKYNLPENFVLYVGDVNYNKNLLALCEACSETKTNLVIVGKSALGQNANLSHIENIELKGILDKYGDDKYISRVGFVEDEELPYFFKAASIYCQPSRYEGFGLSVLDAMTSGLAVLSSDIQVSREIWGDNVEYFDINNKASFVGKIKTMIGDSSIRKNFANKGLKYSEGFSWKKCAEDALAIYKKVLST
jgi:glycosyltransferase involved in cell wall biosynthesis